MAQGLLVGVQVVNKTFGRGVIVEHDDSDFLPLLVKFDNPHEWLHNGTPLCKGEYMEEQVRWFEYSELETLTNTPIISSDVQELTCGTTLDTRANNLKEKR